MRRRHAHLHSGRSSVVWYSRCALWSPTDIILVYWFGDKLSDDFIVLWAQNLHSVSVGSASLFVKRGISIDTRERHCFVKNNWYDCRALCKWKHYYVMNWFNFISKPCLADTLQRCKLCYSDSFKKKELTGQCGTRTVIVIVIIIAV